MANNLSIDTDLVQQAWQLSGELTEAAAVTLAPEEFVARRQQRRLLDLMGKLDWEPLDYKAERSRD